MKTQQGTTNKFWMVWRINGMHPNVMHDSASSAKAEASRLAEKHPGERFAVLQAMEVYVATINPPQALKCITSDVNF